MFVVVNHNAGVPNVSVERKIYKNGESKDSFVLNIVAQRMFLDLEHEVDHIQQILTRFLAQGVPIFTSVLEQNENGQWRQNEQYPGVLRSWQNSIAEYHVRLTEFKRLYLRGVDERVLREHARQVVIWSNVYFSATGLGKSAAKINWEKQHFSDLQLLREEVNELFLDTGFVFAPWEVSKNQYKELMPQ